MSNHWQELGIGEKVRQILGQVGPRNDSHYFGRQFLSAYQLAIRYAHEFPNDVVALNHEIGGKGSGVGYGLAGYLANQLSRNGRRLGIEGRDLSLPQGEVKDVVFVARDFGEEVRPSTPHLSMFRLVDEHQEE